MQKEPLPRWRKHAQPLGMALGIIFGVVVSAALQWVRDGGVVQGATIGLMLGLAVFGPVFGRWLARKSSIRPPKS